jgi:osmotically-inducible protein OsmY
VRQRLALCRQANAHLVRVTVRDGTVYLDGRAPDVPRGVWAVKVAAGFVPLAQVVNRLQVTS